MVYYYCYHLYIFGRDVISFSFEQLRRESTVVISLSRYASFLSAGLF